jgi:hypothetical protein
MKQILLRALVAITLCSLVSAAAYYFLNIYAMVLSLPLFGLGLSRVIIDLIAELRHVSHDLAIGHLNGHFYSYCGVALHVLEDESHCRWIPTAVLRKIMGGGATDGALAVTYRNGWCAMGKPERGHLRDDALMVYLTRASSIRGIKFRNWAERNIAFPARRQRERLGIRLPALDSEEGDDPSFQ